MKWRKLNNILHRDLGYLAFGLTIVYAVSGIAVNHVADWNPNYKIERIQSHIDPPGAGVVGREIVAAIEADLDKEETDFTFFQDSERSLSIFRDGSTVSIDLVTGEVRQEKIAERTGIYEMNFLHLNHPKKLWTWMADLYAAVLAILAITGLFVLKGKKGITGRGAWLSAVGIIIPIVFLWFYS